MENYLSAKEDAYGMTIWGITNIEHRIIRVRLLLPLERNRNDELGTLPQAQ